jgi:hypothetical protein
MKISGNGDLLGRISLNLPGQPAASMPRGFGEILQKTLNEATPAEPAGASAGASVSILFQPAMPLPDPPVMPRVEGFLNLLDNYQRQLADPRVSLKGLDPAVQAMEHGRDTLTPLLDTLPEGDRLKDVLNRALVTAELEIIRFRRGDYLPA